jgi:hypothetical protein
MTDWLLKLTFALASSDDELLTAPMLNFVRHLIGSEMRKKLVGFREFLTK